MTKGALLGSRVSEIYPETAPVWLAYCYKAAILGQEIHDTIFHRDKQRWMKFTVAPVSASGYFSYTVQKTGRA